MGDKEQGGGWPEPQWATVGALACDARGCPQGLEEGAPEAQSTAAAAVEPGTSAEGPGSEDKLR